MLEQLAIILNQLGDSLRLNLQLPEGGCFKLRSPARYGAGGGRPMPWRRK
jgi:hypothetical protein